MALLTQGGHCIHDLGVIAKGKGQLEQDSYCCRCGQERFAEATYVDPADHGLFMRHYDREVSYEDPWTDECTEGRKSDA